GIVKNISRRSKVTLIEIDADQCCRNISIGDSIAVNGVCLTLIKNERKILSFEAIQETMSVSNLGILKVGDKVNLERALKMGDRVSGHFVTGHIDCMGVVRSKTYHNENLCFEIAVPVKFMNFCLSKGSIAVDGVSLTIMEKKPATFCIYIIPHTLKNTSFMFKGSSSMVNIEFDILAKSTRS
ncbi:MAG: riboflavin synthase, partial [Candidatus Omnitrophica bacterium]|nr:riboflavin synthase [Candidatus Omnitrophota bacterium]